MPISSRIAFALMVLASVSCDRSDRDAARWLDLAIERPLMAEIAPIVERDPEPDTEGMVTRTFRLPSTFFYSPINDPSDPFADPEPKPRKMRPPQEILERAGITFGPGAFARGTPEGGIIVVRQTPDQMELVDAYTTGMGPNVEQEIVIRIELYETSGTDAPALIRSAAPHTDHDPEYRAVSFLLRENKARLIQSTTLHVRSGQRARNEDGYELSYSIPQSGVAKPEPKTGHARSTGLGMPRRVGTWLEVDPVVGADELTLDLRMRLDFHTGDPVWHPVPGIGEKSAPGALHPRFPLKTLEFTDSLVSGETRLIGSWKPDSGNEDTKQSSYQLAFLKAFITPAAPTLAP